MMVLAEEDTTFIVEPFPDFLWYPHFLFYPSGHRLDERRKTPGPGCKICLQDPVEFHEWLIIKSDVVNFADTHACFPETIRNRVRGKFGIVFPPCKALFLSGRD